MNNFSNLQKMVKTAEPCWDTLLEYGLSEITTEYRDGKYYNENGLSFINMVSCSYLGLEQHPLIDNEMIKAIRDPRNLKISTSRLRIKSRLIDEVEQELSDYFQAQTLVAPSCAALSEGILPMLAAGILTDDIKPVMVFDRFCHFSMNIVKPICADETKVIVAPHNDIEFLEEICKNCECVAYIADGAYSMGGHTPLAELLALQEKYNLFLYFDDSHSLTAYGKKGYGYIRGQLDSLNSKTLIVYSLNKSFGVSGGMALFAYSDKTLQQIQRYGGPIAWSQPLSAPALGGIKGALAIHRSSELELRQERLQQNLKFFDQNIHTRQAGNPLPIRLIDIGNEQTALKIAANLFENGFYVSAVFFPIVPKNEAGLRLMLNSEINQSDLQKLCALMNQNLLDYKLVPNKQAELNKIRSLLFTPAHKPDLFCKADNCAADLLIIDFEDSLPMHYKETIHSTLLNNSVKPKCNFGYRINSLKTTHGLKDILYIAENKPFAIVVPMVETYDEVIIIKELLPGIKIIATIETPKALNCINQIAKVSDALIFGAADYSAKFGILPTTESLVYPRNVVITAAAAANIPAFDTAFFDLANNEDLARECNQVKCLGFSGKAAIHPLQVDIINKIFSPSKTEIIWATNVNNMLTKQKSIYKLDSQMIGPPFVEIANKILSKGNSIE